MKMKKPELAGDEASGRSGLVTAMKPQPPLYDTDDGGIRANLEKTEVV